MRLQRGPKNELLAIEPAALVLPPALETVAQQLIAEISPVTADGANPFSGALELIVEPGLTDTAAWYLIADPARFDGLAHSFLDGQRTPRIETRAGWERLAMEFRLHWPLAAAFVAAASWYRNPGA